jgi:hypothetical protein
LRGVALPGVAWEGWTIRDHQLFAPNGRSFDAVWLQNNEHVFSQAKLFRQLYAASGKAKTASTVVAFPDRRQKPEEAHRPPQAQPRKAGAA